MDSAAQALVQAWTLCELVGGNKERKKRPSSASCGLFSADFKVLMRRFVRKARSLKLGCCFEHHLQLTKLPAKQEDTAGRT